MIRLFFVLGLLVMGCKPKSQEQVTVPTPALETPSPDSITVVEDVLPTLKSFAGLADTTFVRLADYSLDFVYDLRYASTNNFLKAKVYDCPECYVRVKTAKALIQANEDFMTKGYKIKFFDCYRPNSVQHKMWKIVPNPQYVANPVKGSIHNKGGAIDITLVDFDGAELDMGTDFDFFGKEAHHDYLELPQAILSNRTLLKTTMENHGFSGIRTEWWHYGLNASYMDKIADFRWPCPN